MGDMAVCCTSKVAALIIKKVRVPDMRQRLGSFLFLVRLDKVGPGSVLEAADGIIYLDASLLAQHLELVDVGVFVVSIHSRAERPDRSTLKLQAERRSRKLPRSARIEGMA